MNDFVRLISEKRLDKYGGISKAELYWYNIKLCECFYPSLNCLEVVLRNKMDLVLSKYLGDNWICKFTEIDSAVCKDDLISELNLGFWTRLFLSEFSGVIWNKHPSALQEIFEFSKSPPRLNVICGKMNNIRFHGRNKIFHYGCLLPSCGAKMPPEHIHNLIYKFIRDMGGNHIAKDLQKIDNFNNVFVEGKKRGYL